MTGLVLIFLFVILLAIPGFYVLLHGLFPKQSKRTTMLWAYGLTALLVIGLVAVMFTNV